MTARPRKAFILAAGLGTRLLPLTREIPKPLLPLWGTPMLERVLQLLQRWGVRDVLVNVHHRADCIVDYLLKRPGDGLKITISFEPEILGTGGALRKAEWFFDDKPFWLINADVAADVDSKPLLKNFISDKTISSVWLHPSEGPRTVEMKNGMITSWQSKKAGSGDTFTFCGLHLLSPTILNYLPESGFASIITAYEKAMAQGYRVAGVAPKNAFWADVGTPQQYLDAHKNTVGRFLRKRRGGFGEPALPFTAIDSSARVSPKATLKNVVVLERAVIPARAHVENAIVGRDVVLPVANIQHMALRAAEALDNAAIKALRQIDWPIEKVVAQPMGPRGSARTFTRLFYKNKKVVLVQYDPKRAENTLYAGHAHFLKNVGVPVPNVLLDDPKKNLTIFEDLGDLSLQQLVSSAPKKRIIDLYKQVLDEVFVLHEKGTRAAARKKMYLVPPFRPTLYRWEHDLFADHFLKGFLGMEEPARRRIKKDLGMVARSLLRAPRVLVHRDLQSSNVIFHSHEPHFIDFQGMRYGPAVYDLASLLCDPYVSLSEDVQEELLHYCEGKTFYQNEILNLFWLAAVQRLGQALGAYAKLGESADTRYFRRYIPPALNMLHRAIRRLPTLTALQDVIDCKLPSHLMPKDN